MTLEEYLSTKKNIKDKGDRYTFNCKCSKKDIKGKGVLYKNNLKFEYCSHKPNEGIPSAIDIDNPYQNFQKRKEDYYLAHNIDFKKLLEKKIINRYLNVIIPPRKIKNLVDADNGKLKFSNKNIFKKDVGDIYPVIVGKYQDTLYIFAGEFDYFKAILDELTCTSPIFGEGTNFTEKTIKFLAQYLNIIFVYDNDKAGIKARKKATEKISSKLHTNNIGFIIIPTGKDYCDYRAKHSLKKFLSLPVSWVSKNQNKTKSLAKNANYIPAQFMEKDSKTYFLNEKKDAKTGKVEVTPILIYNFTMRILEQIHDDDGKVSWFAKLTMQEKNQQITKNIELVGSDLVILHKFSEKIAEYNTFFVNTSNKAVHNLFVEYVKNNSTITQKIKTQYLGKDLKTKTFLFCNAIAIPGGKKDLVSISPPKGVLNLHIPKDNLIKFWKNTIGQMFEVYGVEAWKILGFKTGTVFVEQIVNKYGGFPLLLPLGSPKCGKSTLAELILASFGAHREIIPFNFNSTPKAWYRKAMKYRAIPLVLNEYYSNTRNNKTLLSLFDREGYERAKTSNDLETHVTKVNATFVVLSTRHITGYESQAVTSRLVTVDFDKIGKTLQTKEKIMELKKIKMHLSSFVAQALTIDIKKLLQDIEDEVQITETSIDADSRLIETHCIIKCCADAFLESLDILDIYGVGDISNDIREQEEKTKNANAAHLYISTLKAMVEKEDITSKMAILQDDSSLLFSLEDTYPYVKRLINSEELPDIQTLAKLLKGIGATKKRSRELSPIRPKQTWKICSNIEEIKD